MKNPHVERLKLLAKQYHRMRKGSHFDGGILVCHDYAGMAPDRLTWWDDVTFILNDYRVALCWIHPRMAYEDAIDSEAHRMTSDLSFDDLIRDGKPEYKTLGRSRRKIIHTSYQSRTPSGWYEQWIQARQQVMASADVIIAPSIDAEWCRYSRLVSLCVPIEVRNPTDLRELAKIAKRLLKRETTLQELFPKYRYTRADWVREGLHLDQNDLHIHRIA